MAIDVDFVGTDKVKDDYDAIAFQTWHGGRELRCVFDGGTTDVGDVLVDHLNTWYRRAGEKFPVLDYVICSHPDRDHVNGIITILEKCVVKNLVINYPWDVLDDLYERKKNPRYRKENFLKDLRSAYPQLVQIEELVERKHIVRHRGLVGCELCSEMTILSPSRELYVEKLAESPKTPSTFSEKESSAARGEDGWENAKKWVDNLHDDVATEAENETSVVVYVKGDENSMLLVGDAGVEGLRLAVQNAERAKINLPAVSISQVPHHGGRHNVTSSLLDEIIGPIRQIDEQHYKWAFVSTGFGSDHPTKCVTNAYWNRGWNVFVSSSQILHGNQGGHFQSRNYSEAKPVGFQPRVEKWDD